jgi:predicted transcriptional regulator
MTDNPYRAPKPSLVPSDDEKPEDLSDEEWAAIKEAWADVEAGRVYTQEEIEAEVRERQAARRQRAR